MPFIWREYLDLAQFLIMPNGNFTPEAAQRSAVSRAYYAAFCHARNYAHQKHGFLPTKSDADHKDLIRHFEQKSMPNIARHLDRMRQMRNMCDYEDSAFQLRGVVSETLERANKVFDGLK